MEQHEYVPLGFCFTKDFSMESCKTESFFKLQVSTPNITKSGFDSVDDLDRLLGFFWNVLDA
jgi:hypothetical protein